MLMRSTARFLIPLTVGVLALGIVLIPAIAASPTSPGLTSVNGVPLCGVAQPSGHVFGPAHDPTQWHPLVVNKPDGSVLCTFGHEHGADPSKLNSVFGPLPPELGGKTISYPWATPNENCTPEQCPVTPNKHRVYKWLNYGPDACKDNQTHITAFRAEFHTDGNLGAAVRYHSYWIQAQLTNCATGQRGVFQGGGYDDYANLHVGDHDVVPDLPVPTGNAPAGCVLLGDTRQEGGLGETEQSSSVWYGSTSRAQNGQQPACDDPYGQLHFAMQNNLGTNMWGPVDPTNPSAVQLYANRDRHDGTLITTDGVSFNFPNVWSNKGASGFADVHGNVSPGCTAASANCAPFALTLLPAGIDGNSINVDMVTPGTGYDGDVVGPNGRRGFYVQEPWTTTASPAPTHTPAPQVTATPVTDVCVVHGMRNGVSEDFPFACPPRT